MKLYCLGFALHGHGVLLVEKLRPSWQKGLWNGVGGKVEPGEPAFQAMQREFLEETGLVVEDWRPICTLHGPDWEVSVYTAQVDGQEPKQCTDEKVGWWPVNRLPPHVTNLPWLLAMIGDSDLAGRPLDVTYPNSLGMDTR